MQIFLYSGIRYNDVWVKLWSWNLCVLVTVCIMRYSMLGLCLHIYLRVFVLVCLRVGECLCMFMFAC